MRINLASLVFTALFSIWTVPLASGFTVLTGGGADLLKSGDREKWSDGMREGARLVGEGRHEEAFAIFLAAAKNEELIAHHMVGVMQRDGQGTPQNLELAKKSLTKAASAGSSLSKQELELLRFAAPADVEEFASARKELEALAIAGMSRPQLQVGIAHLEGYGFAADAEKALGYLKGAAEGDGLAKAPAAFLLGKLYRDGLEQLKLAKNPELAERWFKVAAEIDHSPAVRALGEFYLASESGKQDFARARVWFSRLERLGDPAGSYFMGLMSESGWGVEEDFAAAVRYYRTAADAKVPLAFYKLAEFHQRGVEGIEKDREKAIGYYRRGAELGHAVCMYNLAGLLDEKIGADAEVKAEVHQWLIRAAGSGLREAEFKIGIRYQRGEDVPQDLVAAASWFDRAARSGHGLAQFHLGEMYENAHGVARDYKAARRLYQLSAANGIVDGHLSYAVALANGLGGERDVESAYVYAVSATQVAPQVERAAKVRDALERIITPEQLSGARKRLAAIAQKSPQGD